MVMTYDELENLLFLEEIEINNTHLFELASKLASQAEPNLEFRNDKKWLYFYFPVIGIDDHLRTPARELLPSDDVALIPLALIWKKNDEEKYIIDIPNHTKIGIKKGNEKYEKVYERVIEYAIDYIPELKKNGVSEKHVPYIFRSGRIKRKYIVNPEMSSEEAKKFLERYEKRNRGEAYPISLKDYLRVAGYCLKEVFGEKDLTDITLYRKHADFRDGGLLDLDENDTKSFIDWLTGKRWIGSHPFEIITDESTGIVLFPPEETNKRYQLFLGASLLYKEYLKCTDALLKNNVPFDAPDLERALDHLTGESYINVNKGYISFICDGSEYYKNFVEWDPLTVPKFK